MLKSDLPEFSEALNALAEVFGKAAITQKAMRLWFDVLSEFDASLVLLIIRGWAKVNGKFPAPNDVWKVLNDSASRRRESIAEAEKNVFAEGLKKAAATPNGARAMATIRAILESPRPDPRKHWQRVMATQGLPDISYRYAQMVIGKREQIARVPGQDDEEREAA